MIYQPYPHVSIDLANTPSIEFYKNANTNLYELRVGAAKLPAALNEDDITKLRSAIKDYHTNHGGRYYWFFNNIAVNLDIAYSVSCNGQEIFIEYPACNWRSGIMQEAQRVYDGYNRWVKDNPRKPKIDNKAPEVSDLSAEEEKKKTGKMDENLLGKALEKIDRMIGLDGAKKDIRQNVALARFDAAKKEMGIPSKPISRHMVFTGNPGTGKTTFAREVARIYHALGYLETDKVVEATREDLVAEYTGQTAPKTRKKLEEAKGGVLFIDEAYSLTRDKSAFRDVFGSEAIDTLVAGMENMRDDLVVIVAGYPAPMKKFIDANEGLKSRFVTYIAFEDYTFDQLGKIIDLMIEDRGYTITPTARDHLLSLLEQDKAACEEQFKKSDGELSGSSFGNGRAVRTLVEAAEKALAQRLDNEGVLATGSVYGMTTDERKALLTTVTHQDVQGLTLQGIKVKETPSKGFDMGFVPRDVKKPVPGSR